MKKIDGVGLLESFFDKAKDFLENENKLEKLLQDLERKLKEVPIAGEDLSKLPVMASMLRSYFLKEYTNIPMGSLVAIVASVAYFVSPIDLIPDLIPVVGFADDAAVIAACYNLVKSDVNDYIKWREENSKII